MKKNEGVFYSIASSAGFGLMPIFAKLALNYGGNSITILMLRFMFAWLLILPILIYKKKSLALSKKQLLAVGLIGGVAYSSTTLILFLAYNYMSVGLATTIHFIYPISVTLIAIIFFKERIYKEKVLAIIISTIGIILLIYNGDIKLSFLGVFYSAFSGVLYSIYISSIEHSEAKNVDSFVLTFYISLISSFILLFSGLATNSISLNIDFRCYAAAFLIALISTVFAITFFQKAIAYIGSSNASILSTFEPLVSLIFGVIVFREVLSFKIILGCILILSSIIILTKAYVRQA